MTLQRPRTRRNPFLMRRRLSRSGTANSGAFENDCDVVSNGNDVRAGSDDVIVSVCNPFTVVVGADDVIVDIDDVIVGV